MTSINGIKLGWNDCHPKIQKTMAASAKINAANKYFLSQGFSVFESKPGIKSKWPGNAHKIFQFHLVDGMSDPIQSADITKPKIPKIPNNTRSKPINNFFFLNPIKVIAVKTTAIIQKIK